MTPRFEPGRPHDVNIRFWMQGVISRMHRPPDVTSWQRSSASGSITFADASFRLTPSLPVRLQPTIGPIDRFEARPPESIPYASVTAIRFAAHYVEVEFGDSGGPTSVAFTSATSANRERLMWELALRLPEAMEATLRADGGTAPTPLGPTGRRGANTEPPSADHAMDDLGDRMSGLGSALAPQKDARRSPPRSGLGTGLFAAPPSDDD